MSSTTEFLTLSIESLGSSSPPPARKLSTQVRSIEAANASLRFPNRAELRAPAGSNVQAFNELIQSHKDICMRRALALIHNRSDAEDAVQTAFRKAFQHREQFHGNGPFAAWLGRIVENECLMRIRKERSARFVSLDSPTESNTRLELVGSTTNPEDELGWREVVQVLRSEMRRMPPLFRNIMLLHDSEELPMPDVAKRLGVSVPAAKSRLSRARMELRSRIGKHCGRKGPGTLLEKTVYSRTAYMRVG
jgi:RNA polymerase sigma-70 factor, ECF subfamily